MKSSLFLISGNRFTIHSAQQLIERECLYIWCLRPEERLPTTWHNADCCRVVLNSQDNSYTITWTQLVLSISEEVFELRKFRAIVHWRLNQTLTICLWLDYHWHIVRPEVETKLKKWLEAMTKSSQWLTGPNVCSQWVVYRLLGQLVVRRTKIRSSFSKKFC